MAKAKHNPLSGIAVIAIIAMVAIVVITLMLVKRPVPQAQQNLAGDAFDSGNALVIGAPDGGRYCNCEAGQVWCGPNQNCDSCCGNTRQPNCPCGYNFQHKCETPCHNVTIGNVPTISGIPEQGVSFLYAFSVFGLMITAFAASRYRKGIVALQA